MNKEVRIKQVFPGGNTSKGFYSFYDYILPQDEAKRIIIIKGGPGVGKSTFMKKIALEMVDRGYDVEFMHCSSDNNSLDGVVIPAIKVALLDGTAPHVVDPKNPGCIDEIIHLGDYWNEDGVRAYREKIVSCNKEVGKCFARAYKYIAAAKSIYDDIEVITAEAVDRAKVNQITNKLITDIFAVSNIANEVGRERHLFASAITPEGLKNYLSTVVGTQDRVYVLTGLPGVGLTKLFCKITEASIERGYYTESYHCALSPDKIEHIVIPELGVALTTSNNYHTCQVDNPIEVINMDSCLNADIIGKYEEIIANDKSEFNNLLNKGVSFITKAKVIHDQMENYYIPNMNFDEVQKLWEKTLDRILKYELESC